MEDNMPLPFVINVPAAVTAKAPCLRVVSLVVYSPARHHGAPRRVAP